MNTPAHSTHLLSLAARLTSYSISRSANSKSVNCLSQARTQSSRQFSISKPIMAHLKADVPTLKLNDGHSIPLLAYGTGTAQYKSSDTGSIDKGLVKTIKMAIDTGYYHLDGAEMYNNELELGQAIKESGVAREKLFVTTKVLTNVEDIPNAIDKSLKKLQLEYVDLYLIHSPYFAKSEKDFQEKWAQMEEVQKSGKAKSIGVSNYLPEHLEATLKNATIPPAVNQLEFHLYLQREKIHEFCKSKGIALEAYGPLSPITKAKPGPADNVLASLAKKYYVGEGEILLRWCIDQGVVAVTTSAKQERLTDYLRVLAFKLTPKEVEDLNKAGVEKHYRGFWAKKFEDNDRT